MNIFKEKYDLHTLRGIQLVVKYGFISSLLVILFHIFGLFLENIVLYIIFIPIFISGMVYLYGYFLILANRREFNIKHQKNVITAFLVFVIYHILRMFLAGYYPISDLIKMYSTLTTNLVTVFVLIYFILELTEPMIKKILWMVIPFTAIVGTLILVFPVNYGDILYPNEVNYNILIAIGMIPNFIILFCYYKTLIYLTNNLPAKTNPSETANN